MALTTLTSLDNPKIKAVVKLQDHATRRAEGLLVAQGQREMQRAIQAGLQLVAWYECPTIQHATHIKSHTPPWQLPFQATQHAKGYQVTEPLMLKIAYKDKPEGILGIFEQPKWSWDSLAQAANHHPEQAALYLVAVGLSKPGNLGAMVRSAMAAGATALLVADGVVDPWNPNAIRSSTGAVFSLPILGASSQEVRAFLARQQVPIYATSPTANQTYTQVNLTVPAALVIGAEDTGLDDHWLQAGQPIAIPMETTFVDSLNASVTAGILLFEAQRQRLAYLKQAPSTR